MGKKGEKAKRKFAGLDVDLNAMGKILENVSKTMKGIIKPESDGEPEQKKKQRSMIIEEPERIEFKFSGLNFYIDFTIEAVDYDGMFQIEGCMLYGANRALCFSKCIFNDKDLKKCEACERVGRCDGYEDNAFIKFSINRHKLIQCMDKFEEASWLITKKDLTDLHYRALEKIWAEALAWTNENLFP